MVFWLLKAEMPMDGDLLENGILRFRLPEWKSGNRDRQGETSAKDLVGKTKLFGEVELHAGTRKLGAES